MTNRKSNNNLDSSRIKDVYSIHMQELIKDVLSKAAFGKARNHFFHDRNEDFKQSVNNLAATLTALGLACKSTDDIVVESTNRRNRVSSRYKVSDYQVPTNIGLFEVLNIGEFYTSDKMRNRNLSIGDFQSNYEIEDDSRILSPDEVQNVYVLLEMTANSGWEFGSLTKPGYLISDLSVVRGEEECSNGKEFFIVEGDGGKLSVDVLLATGLTFSDSEFPVKRFYPDEVHYNENYYQLVENLAINLKTLKDLKTRKENQETETV